VVSYNTIGSLNLTRRLLFVVNEPDFFLSHRLPLAIAARARGYDVHIATRFGSGVAKLRSLGFPHHVVPLSRSGKNVAAELWSLWTLVRLMRRLRPDVVHLVTIKPVLYGGIAARVAGVSAVVAAVSGLGFVFTSKGIGAQLLRGVVIALYRSALKHRRQRVIFQNPTDRLALVDRGIVPVEQTVLLAGSGVDLRAYRYKSEAPGVPVVVMASRLLNDKGVHEFVRAAARMRKNGVVARFLLAGEPDPGNPQSVSEEDVAAWRSAGDVEVLGYCKDVASLFYASHVVVLPSYYGEGLPKVLAEAAACGRAIVTTDLPGCRDSVDPGVSGLLIPARDVASLCEAIRKLIDDPGLRQSMGRAGRQVAEGRYSIEHIVAAHLEIYATVLAEPRR
jgi:glycosyltransferase involved in cell wall biosynthesis